MNNILQQLYVQTKDGMTPIFINDKTIEVNNLENVTEGLLNNSFPEYNKVIDRGNGNVYEQYEPGKWSGIKGSTPTPDTYIFTVNKAIINFDSIESSETVNIVSTKNGNPIEYYVNSKPEWIIINNNVITVQENTSQNERDGVIQLIQSESYKTCNIAVFQDGTSGETYVFNVEPTTINAFSEDSIKTIAITSTKDSVNIPVEIISKPDWIIIIQE